MSETREPEPDYLQRAASILNDALQPFVHRAMREPSSALSADVLNAQIRAAHGFAELAAVQRGISPCCHHLQPEQEPQ